MGNATNSIWNEIWALKRAVGTFTGADTQVSRLLPPRNLAVRGGFKSLHITWENQKYTSLPHTEIFLSETENIADGRSIATVMSNAYSIFDLDVIRPYWVWARGVDLTSWKYSDWAGPVSAITNGLEEEDFLVGEIAESALAPALAEKIDFINLLDLKFEDKIDYIDLIDLKLEDYVVDLTDMYQYVINEFNTLSTSIVDYLENTSELYTTITNAGIITDPETGTVQIFGLEAYKTENDARLSSVELNIDAVESTLTSKVSLAEVDERIAGAVFGDAGELLLSGVDARMAVVEETLDGVEAELLEKATYVEVYELGGRMGTAETRLDGMDAEIDLLATSTELDAVESRVTTAEININAVEGKITQAVVASVTLTQDEEEMLADGLVNAMLNDHEWNTYATEKANSVIAIAKTDLYAHIDIVETDLYSHIDDVLTAEAGERTLLAAQIAGNTGAIQSESVVRANADYALSSEITTLQSSVGANASAIQTERTTRANADSAEATARQQLAARVGTAEANILENADAIADVDGNVRAQWTLQTQAIGAKTAVAGIGLFADGQTGTSEFTVLADKFFVYNPATGAPKKVFQIVNNQALMNGDMLVKGTVQGEKLAATSTIQLANGGKLLIGTNGSMKIGQKVYMDDTRATFVLSSFQIVDTLDGTITIPFEKRADGKIYLKNVIADKASISDATLANATIGNGTITNAMIKNAAITDAKIGDLAVKTAKIDNLAVTSIKLDNLAVTSAKIAEGAITSAKIGTAAIETAHIKDAAIKNSKIDNLAVDRIKIKDHELSEFISDTRTNTIAPSASGTNHSDGSTIVSSVNSLTCYCVKDHPIHLIWFGMLYNHEVNIAIRMNSSIHSTSWHMISQRGWNDFGASVSTGFHFVPTTTGNMTFSVDLKFYDKDDSWAASRIYRRMLLGQTVWR